MHKFNPFLLDTRSRSEAIVLWTIECLRWDSSLLCVIRRVLGNYKMNGEKRKFYLMKKFNVSNISNAFILNNENTILLLILIYLIMLALNCITPMVFGDDYVYSFVWEKNQAINTPLPETAKRISSFYDILVSQWNHYFYWGGRTVAHVFVQYFAWIGKNIFNFFNALMFTILVLQVSWIANEGKMSLKDLNPNVVVLTFLSFWFFTASFSVVHLWMTGACNYVWTMVILLFFLLPYIRQYFNVDATLYSALPFKHFIFCFGIIAGWTNENTICWVICFLGAWLFGQHKSNRLQSWMLFGYIGLCIDYSLLILAPGNAVRTILVVGKTHMFRFMEWKHFRERLMCFLVIEFFQSLIWLYIADLLKKLQVLGNSNLNYKHLKLAKVFCVLNILSNAIMLFVPDFQPRSGFPSLVFLTIALALLLRVRQLEKLPQKNSVMKGFVSFIYGSAFLITLVSTIVITFKVFSYTDYVINQIKNSSGNELVHVTGSPKIPDSLWHASGLHLMSHELDINENNSKNVAVSRYYNIKGISAYKSGISGVTPR